jgi:predicted enzyme related to lactoylglutathione lyase
MKLFRVILPVGDIGKAAAFYEALLALPGKRVSPGRHYFDCEGTILACFDPRADGDKWDAAPNPDHVYFATDALEDVLERAQALGCATTGMEKKPWGERLFYARDPFGNRICFVDRATMFTGA